MHAQRVPEILCMIEHSVLNLTVFVKIVPARITNIEK